MTDTFQPVASDSTDARDIYQAMLDDTSRLVLNGDADAYCQHVVLPFVLRTSEGETVIESHADMATDILKINTWLQSQGVTDYIRLARTARFLDRDTVEGFHVTYALRNALHVIDPYSNRMILKRGSDGMWRATSAEHELAGALHSWHKPTAVHGAFSAQWSGKVDGLADAMPRYQGFLDRNSRHANTRDFDAWVADFTVPYLAHYNAADHHVHSTEDSRAFFDQMIRQIDKLGADQLVRSARHAVFLSPDRIFGYHEATMTKAGAVCFGPIQSRMILVLEDDRWKCSSVTNSLSNTGFPGGDFEPSENLPTLREIQKRMKK
jgi:hypothetical protein